MNILLTAYLEMFLSIHMGRRDGQQSISKPLYLLAILEAVNNTELLFNKIEFPNEFIHKRFGMLYEQVYNNRKGYEAAFFIRPFFHLASSNFYQLVWKDGIIPPSMSSTPSAKYLREHLRYAKLDEELWELLQDAGNREYLRRNIIARYLPNNNIVYHGEQV